MTLRLKVYDIGYARPILSDNGKWAKSADAQHMIQLLVNLLKQLSDHLQEPEIQPRVRRELVKKIDAAVDEVEFR